MTFWIRRGWKLSEPKTYSPILQACVSNASTSVVFIVRHFVIRLFSYLTKSILPLFYDSFSKRLFSFLTKSILPLFYDSFVIRLFSLFTLNNNVWYIDNSHSILILWHHVSSIHCYQCINVFNGVKKICFMGLAIYRIILDDFES